MLDDNVQKVIAHLEKIYLFDNNKIKSLNKRSSPKLSSSEKNKDVILHWNVRVQYYEQTMSFLVILKCVCAKVPLQG